MIFKTITDETTLSGQRIVGALQARKIAQQQATAQLEIDIACLKEYQVACQNGTVTTEQFDAIMHKASASAVEYSAKVKAGTGTAQSYANTQRATNSALQEVSIGAGIASKAVKLFSTALNMIAFTAIIQGISWLIGKVDEWIVTAKEAKESADAFKQSLSTFFNETQANLKTISSLSDRFDELSKNVDDNGKKVGGTEEEYAEFLDICQQVGQIMPELITGYTAEGEAIITLQGKVDSLTDSYKEAIKAKAALFISKGDEEGNTIDSFFEDYDNFINGYKGLWDLKTSPSGQNSLEDFEEYYGYDKIHEWLSKVKDASLNELNNLEGELATAQRGYMYIAKILDDSDFDITNITEENYNAIHDVLNNRFTVMEKELSNRVINIRSAFQNMLYADSDYWNIDDENVLSAINSLYGSIDSEFIKNNELFSQKALQTFESDFVSLFNNDATKQAMVDFYTPIADDETVKDYADRIKSSLETVQSYCDGNGITVPINFDDSEQTINDLEAQYQRAVNFAKDKFDGYDPTAFFKEHSINTQEEIDAWQEIAQGARDAAEAEKEYIQGSTLNENPILSTITSSIEQIATQLEPQFKKLGDAYKDIFTADGFTLEAVDNSMLEDLRKSFAEIEDEIGVTFDAAQLEDFFVVLSNSNSTAEQTQEAFNKIATSYLYSTDVLENLNNTTVDSIAKQLEALGIVNASEVATEALAAKEEYLAFARKEHVDETGNLVNVTQDLSNATADDINVLIAEQDALEGEGIALDEATQKMIAYWMQKQAANGQLSTVGDIQQLGALCEALGVSSKALRNYIYFKQLASMTDVYDAASIERFSANAEKNMEQAQADIQSIYGKLGGAEINFAVPDTSKKSGSSSKSEKDTTKEFDWIEQAIENVEKEVKSLDDVVNSAYSTFSQKNEALAKEIGKVNEEIELQQQAYDEYMRKADSIGLSDDYKTLIHDGAINIENISDEKLQNKISEYQQWYDKAIDASDAISELSTKVKDLHVAGYELQADRLEELLDNESITEKKYLSEMKKLYKEYYENQVGYAQKAHEAKLALLDREKQYLNSVANAATSLLDKEINKVQDNAKEQQKPYEDQIKAAEKQIDVYQDQIKIFEKQIDAHNKQIDAYNKEIDLINDRKKPLQDELDALEDKAREENLILDLQEKQYNLKKTENQRDKLVNYMPDAIVI